MNKETPPSKRRYVIATYVSAVIFLICGVGYGLYWFVHGQYYESVDDCYVNGNLITIKPFEEGIVISILADNAQMVERGQPLFKLDPHDFEIALEKAKADLAQTMREVVQMFLKAEEIKAKLQVFEAEMARARLDYEHRLELVSDGSVSREEFEHSEMDYAAAAASVIETEKEWFQAVAQIENTTPFTHPKIDMAKAVLKKAFLALQRCTIVAPDSGIISQRKVQLGQWVRPGEPMMALIPLDQIWVDANFREVSLKHFRVGQEAEIYSDMYGKDVKYKARIVGLNPGTGSVFSILPPQNATGNWIKIIQRVPVKLSLNAEEVKAHPLLLGLTMTTTVDTHDRSLPRLPVAGPSKAIYTTDVYEDELAGVDSLIEEILRQNCAL